MQTAGAHESLQRISTTENHEIKRWSIIMHALQFFAWESLCTCEEKRKDIISFKVQFGYFRLKITSVVVSVALTP